MFESVSESLRQGRGCKLRGNKLSTSARSQEQVLSNQTLNKHIFHALTLAIHNTFSVASWQGVVSIRALHWLDSFYLVWITEWCVFRYLSLSRVFLRAWEVATGSTDGNLMNPSSFIDPTVSLPYELFVPWVLLHSFLSLVYLCVSLHLIIDLYSCSCTACLFLFCIYRASSCSPLVCDLCPLSLLGHLSLTLVYSCVCFGWSLWLSCTEEAC